MTGGQLAITLVVVILVGAGAAAVAVVTQPDAGKYEKQLSALTDEIRELKDSNDKRFMDLEAKIDESKKDPATYYPAFGDITIRMSALDERMAALEKKAASSAGTADSAGAPSDLMELAKKEEPIGKFVKELSDDPDNPQKAVKNILKTETGQSFAKLMRHQMISQMKTRLNLDDRQSERAKEIVEKSFDDALKILTDDSGKSQEEIQAELQKLRESTDSSMREILDDEQYQKYQEMSKRQFRMGGFGGQGGGGAQPNPAPR
jgi:hypothetical protein